MEAMLEDNMLKEFIDKDIPEPPASDAKYMAEWRKCVAKERTIILEGVQDHIISNLHGKETTYAMWKALTVLSRCATTMVVRPGINVSSVFCTTRSDVESSADVASSSSRICMHRAQHVR